MSLKRKACENFFFEYDSWNADDRSAETVTKLEANKQIERAVEWTLSIVIDRLTDLAR